MISKPDIQSRDQFPLSMVPEGLLDPFTHREVNTVELLAEYGPGYHGLDKGVRSSTLMNG